MRPFTPADLNLAMEAAMDAAFDENERREISYTTERLIRVAVVAALVSVQGLSL